MDKNRRIYRTKVKCDKCHKILVSDYKREHLKRKHGDDQTIKFSSLDDPKQRKLSFASNFAPAPPNDEAVIIESTDKELTKLTAAEGLPATSCSAERSFSGLRRLKTYLRSTMGQTRLSNLALLHLERPTTNKVDVNRIVDIFGQRSGRNKYFF